MLPYQECISTKHISTYSALSFFSFTYARRIKYLLIVPWALEQWVLNQLIISKRTMERTNLCICCCICSPEAVFYLYIFLEVLGVQVVQEAQGVQVHLLHLCKKWSTMLQPLHASRQSAENHICPHDGLLEISEFLRGFCVINKLPEMLFLRMWAIQNFTNSKTWMQFNLSGLQVH